MSEQVYNSSRCKVIGPLEQTIPGGECKPILGFGTDVKLADNLFQLLLHFLDGFTFIRQGIQILCMQRLDSKDLQYN